MDDAIIYEAVGDMPWYPHECFDCKHWWMGGADPKCPKCGSGIVGVAGCPPLCMAVDTEEEESE
jgi:hypothetical protein